MSPAEGFRKGKAAGGPVVCRRVSTIQDSYQVLAAKTLACGRPASKNQASKSPSVGSWLPKGGEAVGHEGDDRSPGSKLGGAGH